MNNSYIIGFLAGFAVGLLLAFVVLMGLLKWIYSQ